MSPGVEVGVDTSCTVSLYKSEGVKSDFISLCDAGTDCTRVESYRGSSTGVNTLYGSISPVGFGTEKLINLIEESCEGFATSFRSNTAN